MAAVQGVGEYIGVKSRSRSGRDGVREARDRVLVIIDGHTVGGKRGDVGRQQQGGGRYRVAELGLSRSG